MEIAKRVATRISAGFGSYLQTVRMIVFPFIFATPAVLLWNFLYKRGWHSPSLTADEPIVNAILPGLLVIHVLFAGFMFSYETNKLGELRNAIREEDRERFLDIAENRMPRTMKYILFVSANLTMAWTMILHYEIYWVGLAAVYSVGYLLSLIWETISDFDDPVNGMWVTKGIPEEWIRGANIQKRVSDRIFEFAERLFKRFFGE